jgi:hypothetical protein
MIGKWQEIGRTLFLKIWFGEKGGFMEIDIEEIKINIKLKISPRKKRD